MIPDINGFEWDLGGSRYVLLLRLVDKGASLLRLFVYASLFSPALIGIYTAGVLAINILKGVSQLGFRTALIQIDTSDERFRKLLDTSWTVQVIRGIVLAVFAVLIAPFFSHLMNDPTIAPVVMLLATVPIIEGVVNPEAVKLERDMDFRTYAVYWMSGSLLNLVIALSYLLIARDVYGLVYGQIAGVTARTVASYVLCTHTPRPRLVVDEIFELVDYGKWIFSTGILDLILTKLDDVVIGVFFGTGVLGAYSIAYRIGTILAVELRQVFSRVLLPKFSRIKRSETKIDQPFIISVFVVATIFFPVGIGIAVVGPAFVFIALGDQWREAEPLVRILAIYGALIGIETPLFALVQAFGAPNIETKIKLVRLVIQVAVIYWLLQAYAAIGVALTLLIAVFATFGYQLVLVGRLIDVPLRTLAQQFVLPTVASSMMVGILMWSGLAALRMSIVELVAAIALGAVVYILAFTIGALYTDLVPTPVRQVVIQLTNYRG